MTDIRGDTAQGWGIVGDAFRANFNDGLELGAACCVYSNGRSVVDLWGGVADGRTGRAWGEDAVVVVFSTTKGATAICAHMLVERGELDLDAPVRKYWPEFGNRGKDGILVRWLLSHQAGLPVVDGPLTLDEVCAWEPLIRALEAQAPLWEPGERHAYHGHTYGFLVGEVVRRVAGKSLGIFFADEIGCPLNLSAWIGLPEEIEPRVAHVEPLGRDEASTVDTILERLGWNPSAAREAAASWRAAWEAPDSVGARASRLGGAFPQTVTEDGGFNARSVRAAEHPGGNMVTDARSLARMYAATISDVDGTRLLNPKTVNTATVVQTAIPFSSELEGLYPQFALGFQAPSLLTMPRLLSPRSFGHPGAGGSIGFADPDMGVAFGYVMNRMGAGHERVNRLVTAVSKCIG